jgi:chromosome segregation ATPase
VSGFLFFEGNSMNNEAVRHALKETLRICGDKRTNLGKEIRILETKIGRLRLSVRDAEQSEYRARCAEIGASTTYDSFAEHLENLPEHDQLASLRDQLGRMADQLNLIRSEREKEQELLQRATKKLESAIAEKAGLDERAPTLAEEYSNLASQIGRA